MIRRQSPHHRGTIHRSALHLWAALAFALLSGAGAHAQTQPQAKLIAVTQTGSANFSSAEVAALAGLQNGAMVDRSAIQNAANRLAASGLFASVRYQFSTNDAGLSLTFMLQDAPLFPVELDNFPWFSPADLFAAMKRADIPFHGTAPAAGAFDDQIAQQLRQMLAAKNVQATVVHAVSATPGTTNEIIQFTAQGTDLKLAALHFTDPLASRDAAIQSEISTIKGQPFSLVAVERFEFANVRPVYLSHAYLQVQFGTPEVQLSGNDVNVTVPIAPGPAYDWGGVTWSGNHAYTTADLDSLVSESGLTSGALADGNKINAIWQSVRQAYGHRGYIDARVTPEANFNPAARTVSYAVSILEGSQYRMGKLVLTGLSMDAEKRLRTAWKIPAGQIFDMTYCRFFLAKGATQALKGLPAAQDKMGHYLQKNRAQHTVDVMIDFQ